MSDPSPVIDVSSGRPFDGLGAPVRRLIHPRTVGSDQLGVSICDMPPGSRGRNVWSSADPPGMVRSLRGAVHVGEGEQPGLSS
jgi:hypothetical protein